MFTGFVFWPCFAGLVFLAGGLGVLWKRLAAARGLEKVIAMGPLLVAASLATFGAEHITAARFVSQAVPAWMPGHLFWVYFVALALFCTALSFVLMKFVRLSASLLGGMFLLFVLLVHAPRVAAHPQDRFAWAVAMRDLAFAGGAWAFAGSKGVSGLIGIARIFVAVPLIVFAAEHFLHPLFAPGVPLEKKTPGWMPLGAFWGYVTGAILLAAGLCSLAQRKARAADAWLGLWLILLTLFIYLPVLLMTTQPLALLEAINYVADTLLFAGAVLLLAGAMPRQGLFETFER